MYNLNCVSTWSNCEPVLPLEVLGLVDGYQGGALVLDEPEGLVEPLVVKVGGGQPEEHAVRVVRGYVGKPWGNKMHNMYRDFASNKYKKI